jgi:hypothetical protein
MQQEGKDATIIFPNSAETGNAAFKLNFKYFVASRYIPRSGEGEVRTIRLGSSRMGPTMPGPARTSTLLAGA